MPRASRPLKARVSTVRPVVAVAARCTSEVPASGQRKYAVPSCAASAPATRTAAMAAPVASPPAAINGHSTNGAMSCSAASSVRSDALSSSAKIPRCPPASTPCTMSASGDRAVAATASSGDVTVIQISDPAAARRRTASSPGSPNVNDTTATGIVAEQIDLGVEVVVVEPWHTCRDVDESSLRGDLARVGVDEVPVGRRRAADEHVDTERTRERPADGADLLGQSLRRQVAGTQEPEPTRTTDCSHQRRRRGTACHRRLHDRNLEELQHAHGAPSCCATRPRLQWCQRSAVTLIRSL